METENDNPIKNIFKEIFQTLLISFTGFLILYIFVVQPHRVKGDSMLPNFIDGELLLTEKVSYHFSDAHRGDVVVFRAPIGNKVDFIKRIVGLPDEEIKITGGQISINGKQLKENYIPQVTDGNFSLILGENQYFVLGDNRRSSSDSRSFGPISKKSFRGRVWLVYWPILRAQEKNGLRLIPRIDYSIPDSFNNSGSRFSIAFGNN